MLPIQCAQVLEQRDMSQLQPKSCMTCYDHPEPVLWLCFPRYTRPDLLVPVTRLRHLAVTSTPYSLDIFVLKWLQVVDWGSTIRCIFPGFFTIPRQLFSFQCSCDRQALFTYLPVSTAPSLFCLSKLNFFSCLFSINPSGWPFPQVVLCHLSCFLLYKYIVRSKCHLCKL